MIPGDVHLGGVILHVTLQLNACRRAADHQLCCAGSCRRWWEVIEVCWGHIWKQESDTYFPSAAASLCWESNRRHFFCALRTNQIESNSHLQSFVHVVSIIRLPSLPLSSLEREIVIMRQSADCLYAAFHKTLQTPEALITLFFFFFIALQPKREFYTILWLCETLPAAHYKRTSVSSTWSHHHGFPLSQ